MFSEAGQAFANNAEMAVNGIITKMNAITAIINSSGFGITGDTLSKYNISKNRRNGNDCLISFVRL